MGSTSGKLHLIKFPEGPTPHINSNRQDILLDGRPQFDALIAHAYADSDWATCPKTRRSFGGVCIRLAGGTIAYKCRFQPTVTGSSTKAEFMAACNTGKTILYIQSILVWDLNIPHKKWQLSSMRTTTVVPQWATHRNPPLKPGTST